MRSIWRILRAFCMAAWGHRGQKDKAGKAYIGHLVTVAWMAYGLWQSSSVVIVGLLHDYLEDVDASAGPLIERRFGRQIALSVQNLTRDPSTNYSAYLRHILNHGTGLDQVVKLADLLHNTQPGRIKRRSDMDKSVIERNHLRYLAAIELLAEQRVDRSWGAYR